ncbi:MAG: hypothetical protein ACKVQW_02765 [Pyrinomonadaceae bacterium]
MKNQMIKVTMMIVCAAVLLTGAASANDEIRDYHAKGFFYDGAETSAGNQDPVSGLRYGNTYVLSSVGEVESRYMTVSVNSREMLIGFGVTGGAWSVSVFRDGAHVGTVYGDIMSGDIQDIIGKKGVPSGRQTRIDLQGTGGTGIFDHEGSREIYGSLIMSTDLFSKRTSALDTLNF